MPHKETNAVTTVAETRQNKRTDIRALDGHETWRGVYALLDCDSDPA